MQTASRYWCDTPSWSHAKFRKQVQNTELSYLTKLENRCVYGVIYQITIRDTGKIYIGQTKNGLWDRIYRHVMDSFSEKIHLETHFANAIRKYGPSSLIVHVIDHGYSKDECTEKESMWIERKHSIDPKIGYNETSATDRCGGNTYLSKTDEELAAIKQRISIAQTGANNGNHSSVKARNRDTGEILTFDTVKQAAEFFKVSHHGAISRRCARKVCNPLYGIWDLAYADRSFDDMTRIKMNRFLCSRRSIDVVDLKTGIELSFKSYREFERCYNLPFRTIKSRHARQVGDTFTVLNRFIVTVTK